MDAPLGPHNIQEFLSAFADGELDAAQTLAVLDYLESHPAAFAYLRERQRLRQSAQRLALADPQANRMPDALKARLTRLAETAATDPASPPPPGPPAGPSPRGGRRWRPPWLWAVAAGVAVGLLVGVLWPRGTGPAAGLPTPNPPTAIRDLTPEEVDVRDAAIPVATVRGAVRTHVDCSRLAERLHAGGYPGEMADLSGFVKADLQSTLPEPDLRSIGYYFVGAGPCAEPLEGTVHLLYKKEGPEPRATVSLFAQRYRGQFGMRAGRLYCVRGANDVCPMYAWRTDRVVYFLIADDEPTLAVARRSVRSAPG